MRLAKLNRESVERESRTPYQQLIMRPARADPMTHQRTRDLRNGCNKPLRGFPSPFLVIHGLELLVDHVTTDSIDRDVKPIPLLPLDNEIGQ